MVALVVLVAVNSVFTPNFATAGNLWNVLFQLSVDAAGGGGDDAA